MSNIYLIHRVSVIQRRDTKDIKDDDNDNDDNDKTVEDVTSSFEVLTARPSDATKHCDDIPDIQKRISSTDSDFATLSERFGNLTYLALSKPLPQLNSGSTQRFFGPKLF